MPSTKFFTTVLLLAAAATNTNAAAFNQLFKVAEPRQAAPSGIFPTGGFGGSAPSGGFGAAPTGGFGGSAPSSGFETVATPQARGAYKRQGGTSAPFPLSTGGGGPAFPTASGAAGPSGGDPSGGFPLPTGSFGGQAHPAGKPAFRRRQFGSGSGFPDPTGGFGGGFPSPTGGFGSFGSGSDTGAEFSDIFKPRRASPKKKAQDRNQ